VVLPPGLENLEASTAELLKNFLKSGGEVVSWGENELLLEGKPSSLGKEFRSEGNFEQFEPASFSAERLAEVFSARIKPAIEFSQLSGQEMLFHQRRQYKDGQILFLANISPDQPASGEIKLKGQSLEKWDLRSGQVSYFPAERKGKRISLSFNLQPGESLLLAAYDRKLPRAASAPARTDEQARSREEIRLKPEAVKRLEANVLTIDYCDLILSGRTEKISIFMKLRGKPLKLMGLTAIPGTHLFNFRIT